MDREFQSTSSLQIYDLKSFLQNEKSRFLTKFYAKRDSHLTLDDFEIHCVLGSGSFGLVVLANLKVNPKEQYAIKILMKSNIVKRHQLNNTLNEKRILQAGNFPFISSTFAFFMDNSNLYFVMPYLPGGDLFTYLRLSKRFGESESKFFSSQICLALEYLHALDIIHRDLKPENVLIDFDGYLKLTDFGFSKLISNRTASICGTPDYLAPEILKHQGYGKTVDWWAFGVFIYELNFGQPPFYEHDDMRRLQRISKGTFNVPITASGPLADLIGHLLERDLSKRYGNLVQGADDIKSHTWYREINWLSILNKTVTAPYKPNPKVAQMKYRPFTMNEINKAPINLYEAEFRNF